jgi:hypothetical protein
MPDYIDNVTILKAVDEHQQKADGRPLWMSAHQLLNEITGKFSADPRLMPGFLQELFVARDAGHLTWRLTDQAVRPGDPNYYLQQIQDLALTAEGQDRARGRMVQRAAPAPGEDDGHQLSDLVLHQIAEVIAREYAADQRVTFLVEEGIPPDWYQLPEEVAADDVHAVLAATWRAGSLGRQLVRRFIGRWLDERLITGPDAEQRASLIGQLMRQGWQIRESDSVLVAADPVRGTPRRGAPTARLAPALPDRSRSATAIPHPPARPSRVRGHESGRDPSPGSCRTRRRPVRRRPHEQGVRRRWTAGRSTRPQRQAQRQP